ncbi:MAG: hypothetical protein ACRD4F_02490, partial [Candidatus Angelobacter sp.]
MSDSFFLPENASKARLREAENARKNRAEILKAYSQGKVTRRELMKWGLITAGGALAPIHGLSPFATSAYASGGSSGGGSGSSGGSGSGGGGNGIPTGAPPSPLFGVQAFSTPMPRFDVLARNAVSTLNPYPTAQSNQTQQALNPALVGGRTGLTGPIEGRPPGAIWAHQDWATRGPQVAIDAFQGQAQTNTVYNPAVDSQFNSGIDPTSPIPLKFHPGLPTQNPNSVWTFNGTIPPKLVQGRYGEPILFRHHNRLPFDVTQNNGFGIHTISTHEHNGHHGAEN